MIDPNQTTPIDLSKVAVVITSGQAWAIVVGLGTLLTTIVALTMRGTLYMRDTRDEQRRTNERLDQTNSELTRLADVTWTRPHMTDWVARAQRENPNTKWPIPDGPETPRPFVSFARGDGPCET